MGNDDHKKDIDSHKPSRQREMRMKEDDDPHSNGSQAVDIGAGFKRRKPAIQSKPQIEV